jgi:3-deoxy-D-manno-octulosonic-acid transferase
MKQAANCIPNSQFPRRAEAIIKTFETKEPIRILMTSNTRQGIEIFNQELPKLIPDKNQIQTAVRFFPFDKPSIMTRAVAGIQPKLMVLLETELWPGLLQALKTRCCRIIIINGRITEKSLQRYHLCPSVWQTLRPDKILAISSSDADRFRQFFGPDGVEIMANIKFDRIVPSKTSGDDYSRINSILTPGRPFVVLASVRREEEPQVINIIREIFRNRPQTIMGLFPRHMHRLKFWQQTIIQLGIRCALRSTVSNPVSTGTVILWDTFG